jgi:sugar (pentulose or hexulose) kinase
LRTACKNRTAFDTWNIDELETEIRTGLKKVCDSGILIDSIGIDTWGVDYVLTTAALALACPSPTATAARMA